MFATASRRLRQVAALAAVVAAHALSLTAAPQGPGAWTYASSERFDLYTTGSARSARDVLEYFEHTHAFLADFLKMSPKPPRPTRLIVFSGDAEFAPYRVSASSIAYYAPGPDRDYIVMRAFDNEAHASVAHEYLHLLARHGRLEYPTWLNEGLAEFFSTIAPFGRDMAIGRVPRGRIAALYQGGPLMELPRLFAVRHGSPEYTLPQHTGMFYAQSWALTHMVMRGDRYRAKSGDFLALSATGVPSDEAFARVYERTVAQVSEDLRAYLREDRYEYVVVPFRRPESSTPLQMRPAAPFEASLVLANLLADRLGRPDAARAAYGALAAERPDDLELAEARALFEYRRGSSRDAARPHLAHAVSLGSRHPAIYAALGAVTPAGPERTALLKTAFDLDPADLMNRLNYARATLNDREYETTAETLSVVTTVPREWRHDYLLTVAGTAAGLRQFVQARAAAIEAQALAEPGVQRTNADRMLDAIDAAIANQAIIDARRVRDAAP